MNNVKNEKGAALVLTLFIITLLLLIVLTLGFQVTNTTRQVTTMEKQIDARLLAEMGVDYYHSLIEEITREKSITDFEEIKSRLEDSNFKELDSKHSYELSEIEVSETEMNESDDDDDDTRAKNWDHEHDKDDGEDDEDGDDDEDEDEDDDKVTITFTSTGIANGKEVSIENNTITINFEDD